MMFEQTKLFNKFALKIEWLVSLNLNWIYVCQINKCVCVYVNCIVAKNNLISTIVFFIKLPLTTTVKVATSHQFLPLPKRKTGLNLTGECIAAIIYRPHKLHLLNPLMTTTTATSNSIENCKQTTEIGQCRRFWFTLCALKHHQLPSLPARFGQFFYFLYKISIPIFRHQKFKVTVTHTPTHIDHGEIKSLDRVSVCECVLPNQ